MGLTMKKGPLQNKLYIKETLLVRIFDVTY